MSNDNHGPGLNDIIELQRRFNDEDREENRAMAPSYESVMHKLSVQRYGVEIADWLAREFGWK